MKGKLAWSIVTILFVIIIVLAWILFAVPAPAHAPTVATSTTSVATSTVDQPLHTRVIVTSPVTNASVGQNFSVSGEAPGNWYFEASFPIQVRDKDNNKIGQTTGQAQSDWMTTAQVPFAASITLSSVYHGPATLVLLKDNPSGLPENEDSLEIPIVIQ